MYFLLNQNKDKTAITAIDPNTTVLQFVRQNGLVGTKEGCASGDCGACTAVVGEIQQINNEPTIVYKSINTCIALACSLANKHLITVEGLQQENLLHPVQQAMVDKHGSQCGFCTPGFIMSLFALYQNEDNIDISTIEHALSGNLCRCTGYKTIIEAALSAFSNKKIQKNNDYYLHNKQQIISRLQAIIVQQNTVSYVNELTNNSYTAPDNIDEFADIIINNPQAKIIAGGSDLNLEITQRLTTFTQIVSIKEVAELQIIENRQTELEIYAAVSYQQAWDVLVKYFPAMGDFLQRFASTPIRNWATICANIANASPIGDMPPVLLALGARLKLRRGTQIREIKLTDFFVSYKKTTLQTGEFIVSVIIPKLQKHETLALYKISKRFEDDISAVAIAIKATIKNQQIIAAKMAFGGMAEIPKCAPLLDKILLEHWQNDNLTQELLTGLKQEFKPLSDMRASSSYRLNVSAKLITKFVLQSQGEYSPSLSVFSDKLNNELNTTNTIEVVHE